MSETNTIDILAPRWHDRVVLIADHKIAKDNYIRIHHKNYPHPIYMSGEWAQQFPTEHMNTKSGGKILMRAVPLDKLLEERIQL